MFLKKPLAYPQKHTNRFIKSVGETPTKQRCMVGVPPTIKLKLVQFPQVFGKVIFVLIFLFSKSIFSQPFYTNMAFKDTVFKNIIYGTDTGFAGTIDTLKLDIYKPVGDGNCRRPILIAVHGGAWLSGSKEDANIVAMAHQFAKRGYVVAAINYRLGLQPAAFYTPYALCIQPVCTYAMDSSEYIRALFRAMQDTKGAIRFMKNRDLTDSTDRNNVYLIGESAGAFTSLMAAYTDTKSEKAKECYAQADAPAPDPDLMTCIPTKNSRKRPDLGSINGKLNLPKYSNHSYGDERVRGVAAFYGGAFDPSILRQYNTVDGDTPVIYFYHQTCDVIVDPNKGKIFWKIYYYCYNPVNLCQPFTAGPMSWGSTALKAYIDTMTGHRPSYNYHLVNSGPYSCDPNVVCHGIDNLSNRAAEVAAIFEKEIDKTGNSPSKNNCYFHSKLPDGSPANELRVFPTVFESDIHIVLSHNSPLAYSLFSNSGLLCQKGLLSNHNKQHTIHLSTSIPNGLYFLVLEFDNTRKGVKLIKMAGQ